MKDFSLKRRGATNRWQPCRGSLAWPGRQTHNLVGNQNQMRNLESKGAMRSLPEVACSNRAPGTIFLALNCSTALFLSFPAIIKMVSKMNCPRCGNLNPDGAGFCTKCGASLTATPFLMVTTHTVAGYKIKKVLGLVTGLTPRTRGILGQFIAGFESMAGGEVTAFTSEMEEARWEALERAQARPIALGA